jgi:hypothetical protein
VPGAARVGAVQAGGPPGEAGARGGGGRRRRVVGQGGGRARAGPVPACDVRGEGQGAEAGDGDPDARQLRAELAARSRGAGRRP